MTAPDNCTGCSLHQYRHNVVNGTGKRHGIMFVGQNPGFYEDRDALPFIGKSGQLLDLMAEAAGIGRNIRYRTNAVRCLSPGNRAPKKEEMVSCRQYLIEEVRAVSPVVIVTLGDTALQSLYGIGRFLEGYRGELAAWEEWMARELEEWDEQVMLWESMKGQKGRGRKPKKPRAPKPKAPKDDVVKVGQVLGHTIIQPDTGIPMIPTYHPSFIMRGKWAFVELVTAHLEKARRIYDGDLAVG